MRPETAQEKCLSQILCKIRFVNFKKILVFNKFGGGELVQLCFS